MSAAGEYGTSVRMMVSYGGEIVQGDHDPDAKAAYYARGVHRIIKVGLSERLADLRARMAKLAGFSQSEVCIRYALPGEGLGRLRDVENDGDLWSLVSIMFCHEVSKIGRIRVFLFGADAATKTPAAPLRSASSPSLPTLVVERDTTAASGGASAAPVTQGMPRSASSPSLAMSGAACDGTAVMMKVSYGGEVIQHDGSAASPYYSGGVHRIVRVGLSERLADLRPRLAALAGFSDVRIRYALPEEGLGHPRDVASDGDLWSLVSFLFFHEAVTNSNPKRGRIRVFLFGVDAPVTPAPASSPSLATSSSEDDMVADGAKHQDALPTLAEEDEDLDTMAATPAAGGRPVPQRMRRSTSSSGSDAAAPTAATSSAAALQLAPVVWVPVMAPATVVIPVYPVVRVVDCSSSVFLVV